MRERGKSWKNYKKKKFYLHTQTTWVLGWKGHWCDKGISWQNMGSIRGKPFLVWPQTKSIIHKGHKKTSLLKMHRKLLWTPKCKWGSFISMSNITSHRHSPSLKQKKKQAESSPKVLFHVVSFAWHTTKKKGHRTTTNPSPLLHLRFCVLLRQKVFPSRRRAHRQKKMWKRHRLTFRKRFWMKNSLSGRSVKSWKGFWMNHLLMGWWNEGWKECFLSTHIYQIITHMVCYRKPLSRLLDGIFPRSSRSKNFFSFHLFFISFRLTVFR